MKLLAIDPGQTTGYATFELVTTLTPYPSTPVAYLTLIRAWEEPVPSIEEYTQPFLRLLWRELPNLVIIEDYRVHYGKAQMHIGRSLFTPELIGAFVALCSSIYCSPITTVRIQPSKKGRWPDARIKAKFPEALDVVGHALDAVKLGLAYLEGEKLWTT